MAEEQEKREFNYPKKEDLIEQIKALDDDIEHVSLNLIKCNFEATEKDVEKAFPEFKFIKVKNYNPGSFEVVFDMKIDAINFIRTSFDKKILNRRFFIKMGRQHKEVIEDWACVGYVPKKFTHPKNQGGPRGPHQKKPTEQPEGENVQQGEVKTEERPKKIEKVEVKTESVESPETTQKKGINIPMTKKEERAQNEPHKKPEYKKEYKKPEQKTSEKVKEETKTEVSKTNVQEKKETPVTKAPEVQKQAPKVIEEQKVEDDGWITVPAKQKNKKR